MDDNLHIVITSVYGRTRNLSLTKGRFKSIACLVIVLLAVLGVAGFTGIGFSLQNMALHSRVASLQNKLKKSQTLTQKYEARVAQQKKEKKELMHHAVAELKKRSQAIESLLRTVGVKVHIRESRRDTGGPYKSLKDSSYENLTLKVDQYLSAIRFIPLGAPVPGTITSKFGPRVDPFNGRMAFHEGIDIANHWGTKIMATADGVVAATGHGHGMGNYIFLNHGNHFSTHFFHLEKIAVKRGERVSRGEYLGNLGDTGRSTGPHLHYEILYKGRPVNPLKFMRIAKYFSLNDTKHHHRKLHGHKTAVYRVTPPRGSAHKVL